MSDRLLSLSSYRGYSIEQRAAGGRRFVVVLQDGVTVAGFAEERDGPDAINRACEWVERQTERAG